MHGVIDLGRHNKLPGIFIQQTDDRLLDLLFRDDVAMADQHLLALADGAAPAPFGWFSIVHDLVEKSAPTFGIRLA
ncbi:hypothetical protein ORS3428_10530 [Mesorhizobium sp. ORS 3428]|nr:hypothetical protein ORS3428_10530 [Mesorhizobium sp. ORS 3428]